MLKSSLNSLDVESVEANIYCWVLRIFNAKSAFVSVVIILPSSLYFLEVESLLPYGYTDLIIVEFGAIEFKEIYEMLSKINLLSIPFLVDHLKITCNQHSKEERRNSTRVGLIKLSAF